MAVVHTLSAIAASFVHRGVQKMDYEKKITDLKDRVKKLEERLDGMKTEVQTLNNSMDRDSARLRSV